MNSLIACFVALLTVASGLPVCRCVDHAGESCRTTVAGAESAAAPPSCCASEGAPAKRAPAGEADESGGCCCLDAPPADPATGPPAKAAAPEEDGFARSLAPAFLAPSAPSIVVVRGGTPAARCAGAGGAIRSAPDVPLYRLHAALLI